MPATPGTQPSIDAEVILTMTSYLTRAGALTAGLLLVALACSRAAAIDAPDTATPGHGWPQWRGPHFDGSSEATDLPDVFGPDQNVSWIAKLPGAANATPVVAAGRVFTTALDKSCKKFTALCLDLKDGRVLWQRDMGVGFKQNNRNDLSSPSPVTDGKNVYFMFGNGNLAAFDIEGQPLWSRDIPKDHGEFHFMWLYGSSPMLYGGKLYVQCLHNIKSYEHTEETAQADSYLLAIDPKTGKDIWKHVRPNVAIGESREAYTTPIPMTSPQGTQILVAGGDCLTGNDAETGSELWRFRWNPDHINYQRLIPSPVSGQGLVFACAPKGGAVMAVKDSAQGDVTDAGAAWQTKDFTTDVCVPADLQSHAVCPERRQDQDALLRRSRHGAEKMGRQARRRRRLPRVARRRRRKNLLHQRERRRMGHRRRHRRF